MLGYKQISSISRISSVHHFNSDKRKINRKRFKKKNLMKVRRIRREAIKGYNIFFNGCQHARIPSYFSLHHLCHQLLLLLSLYLLPSPPSTLFMYKPFRELNLVIVRKRNLHQFANTRHHPNYTLLILLSSSFFLLSSFPSYSPVLPSFFLSLLLLHTQVIKEVIRRALRDRGSNSSIRKDPISLCFNC